MNSGSSQDTTWTFGGAVAAPAAGESTAEEVAMQSIDSSTEEDKARPTSVVTPKTVPKAKNASRASTPSRPTSLGSRAAKGNGRESDAPSLPVMQAVRMTAKREGVPKRQTEFPNRAHQEVPLHEDRGVRPRCEEEAKRLPGGGSCHPRRMNNRGLWL